MDTNTNTNINADITDCAIYDNCVNKIAMTPSYTFNPVFTFFLIFATVSLFYHCTTKTDLSLFEEFLRISQEHNFNSFIQSIQSTIQTITDGIQISNDDDVTVIHEPLDINVSNADALISNLTPAIKFEDKYLNQYLALKSQATLVPELIENLANNFVMEHSPNGNIIMFYDYKRGSFGYYADNVIPYRFLEVLGRKYVCTFQCPSLYHYSAPARPSNVDTVVKEETELDKVKEEQEKVHINAAETINIVKKKPVFANFKSYNKDTSNKVVTKDTPTARPKNSSINTSGSNNNPDTNQVIANRYTCHGKICNMEFLKKIDRTIVDKNYKMSFADFKRLKTTS